MGVYRAQHKSLRSVASSSPLDSAIYSAAFNRNCFEEIMGFLVCWGFLRRDDDLDKGARLQRRQTDKCSISLFLASVYRTLS